LRENADRAARAQELLVPLRPRAFANRPLVIRYLGCGTGSMLRWLAPQLGGPQRWTLQDRDPSLLDIAAGSPPVRDTNGAPVVVHTHQEDLTKMRAADLTGTSLVTASALLDLLTREEVDALAAACVGATCAALLTLTVVGRVELDPPHPLDADLASAFNAHQRRTVADRRLLGPDAVDAATEAFRSLGSTVQVQPSPWRLGRDHARLAAAWLRGWVAAACAQRPKLAAHADDYQRQRLTACAAGELRVMVEHSDLLALPAVDPS